MQLSDPPLEDSVLRSSSSNLLLVVVVVILVLLLIVVVVVLVVVVIAEVLFLLQQTESESAADKTEMVFVDQSENIGHKSSEIFPRRIGGILARTA